MEIAHHVGADQLGHELLLQPAVDLHAGPGLLGRLGGVFEQRHQHLFKPFQGDLVIPASCGFANERVDAAMVIMDNSQPHQTHPAVEGFTNVLTVHATQQASSI